MRDMKSQLRYMDREAKRQHRERLLGMAILLAVIVGGLCFMALGVPGGQPIVIAAVSYLVGRSTAPGKSLFGNNE